MKSDGDIFNMIFKKKSTLLSVLSRHMSLRAKSYIVYGALIAGAVAVTIFVFYQKNFLYGQFEELQVAYEEESRLREVDMSILHTIQTQVVALESVDIEYGSEHARKHLKLLLDFYNTVIVQHITGGEDVDELGMILRITHESPTRANMLRLGNVLKKFRVKLEQRLTSSREYRNTLAESFHDRSDIVAMIALVLAFIGFIVLGVINALFFTRLSHDLQMLKKRAQEIVKGHREDRISVTRHDEVGELIESINQMAVELDEHDKTLVIERQKYFQQEKMAAIGVLAAGIAHEVGNPIAAISSLIGELKHVCLNQSCTKNDDSVHKLDMLLEQAERLKTITREVSTFARPQLNERELLDLNGLIRSTCNLMRYDKRWKQINLEMELDANLPAIYGVPDQLTQVIMNLLVNASDTLEEANVHSPTINISTTLDEEEDSIYMVVEDNGCGMDDEIVQHALEAFYTTKEVGKGTGLGLSLCHSIITEHGGQINLSSTPDVGTSVMIFLPLVNDENIQGTIQ